MWFVSIARYLPVMTIAVLLLGQDALGQGVGGQSAAKLGAPGAGTPARPQPDPGTLFAFASAVGQTLQFTVVGSVSGTVWGDGIYTSDSALAAAVVHAGLLAPGESGVVTVEIIAGPASYNGVERHGVASRSYANWDVAYRFVEVAPLDSEVVLPDPGNVSAYRGQNGTILIFEVTGDGAGAIWGSDIYTDDSRLAAVAVHAGVLLPGEAGLVRVEILPGQENYEGADSHGVTSGSYGSWQGSFRVLPTLSGKSKSKLSNLYQ